jgi:hypothetical protein
MQYIDAPCNEGVGDEPAVTTPGNGLGAEDGRSRLGPAPDQAVEGRLELGGLHVVGVAPEAFDPPGGMGRAGTRRAAASQVRLMDVLDA